LIPTLAQDWHVYALDLRGHGKSGHVPGAYRLRDYRDDVVAFIQHHFREPAVLYGHSLGGWIALTIAAEAPSLVRALIVGDTAIYPEHLDPNAGISYLADMPLALRSLSQSLNQIDPDVLTMFRDGRLVADYDPDATLARVTCPLLLLQGNPARGALMSDEDVRRARAHLPQAGHVAFPTLGHGLHVEHPEPILEAVTTFLATI
jgi:pimeloyl-ACP methyl ester carboxylesterase